MKIRSVIFGFFIAMLLTACGGRKTELIAVERETDAILSCDHMIAEYMVNEERIPELDDERKKETANNIGLLLTGPLFMDFSGSEKKEIAALIDRNQHLKKLMANKNCGTIPSKTNTENTID